MHSQMASNLDTRNRNGHLSNRNLGFSFECRNPARFPFELEFAFSRARQTQFLPKHSTKQPDSKQTIIIPRCQESDINPTFNTQYFVVNQMLRLPYAFEIAAKCLESLGDVTYRRPLCRLVRPAARYDVSDCFLHACRNDSALAAQNLLPNGDIIDTVERQLHAID